MALSGCSSTRPRLRTTTSTSAAGSPRTGPHDDRDKAVNGYLGAASQSGLILPNLQRWLDPSLPNKGNVNQDRTAALAAFAKAGYRPQGNRLVSATGKQASMTIVLPQNFSDWVAAAKEVSTSWARSGSRSAWTCRSSRSTQTTQAGTFDAAFGGFGGTGDPYTDFNNALNSSFATPVNTPTANNFERFKDPASTRPWRRWPRPPDWHPAAATDALEQLMFTKVPVVLLYYGGSWGLFSTKHFTGWPSATTPTPCRPTTTARC